MVLGVRQTRPLAEWSLPSVEGSTSTSVVEINHKGALYRSAECVNLPLRNQTQCPVLPR